MRTTDDWSLPERSLEPPESKGLTCGQCGCTLYAGESYILWRGERYCQECASEAVRDELEGGGFRYFMERIADAMGFDILEA